MDFDDSDEHTEVQLLREAAARTTDAVGDGATTATVLAHAIFDESLAHVAKGASPLGIARGIQLAVAEVVARLRRDSIKIGPTDSVQLSRVATIAADNDPLVGAAIADAIVAVGPLGIIDIAEGGGKVIETERTRGLRIDQGYVSPHFVNRSREMMCVLDDAVVLVHAHALGGMRELLPLLEKVAVAGRPLLLVASDIAGEALATLVVNHLRGVLRVCAVKAPGRGADQIAFMQDVATATGVKARVVGHGPRLDGASIEDLGTAQRIIVTKNHTLIVGGGGSDDAIAARVAELERRLATAESHIDRSRLKERSARLNAGAARVWVNAATEDERRDALGRARTARDATLAAIEGGVLPGGGVSLLRAQVALSQVKPPDRDELLGVDIVRQALEAPLRQIAVNAGADGSDVVERVRSAVDPCYGFNAETGEFGDLIEMGVVDPCKVVCAAISNAGTVSSALLTIATHTVDTLADSAEVATLDASLKRIAASPSVSTAASYAEQFEQLLSHRDASRGFRPRLESQALLLSASTVLERMAAGLSHRSWILDRAIGCPFELRLTTTAEELVAAAAEDGGNKADLCCTDVTEYLSGAVPPERVVLLAQFPSGFLDGIDASVELSEGKWRLSIDPIEMLDPGACETEVPRGVFTLTALVLPLQVPHSA